MLDLSYGLFGGRGEFWLEKSGGLGGSPTFS